MTDGFCRPGRLDKLLYVPLPAPEGRVAILQALTRATPLAADVDLRAVGLSPGTGGYSGADLAALVREAAVTSLKVRVSVIAAYESLCAVSARRHARLGGRRHCCICFLPKEARGH